MIGRIAVVIVGYDNLDDVARCVEAVGRSRWRDFEICICENGGTAAASRLRQAIGHQLPGGQKITIIDAGDNLGYAGGVNRCLGATLDTDAWWILNPDTEPDPGALAALVARLERGDCDLAGGILHDARGIIQTCGGHWRPWMARAVAIGRGHPLHAPPDPSTVERYLSYISGASMLVGRRFLQRAGPMRSDYFLFAEEIEWCLRGAALGLRPGFATDAHILHRHGTTTGSSADHRRRRALPIYLDQRNRILVTRDCHPAKLAVAAPLALLANVARYAGRGAFRQCGHGVSGWIAGIRDQRGKPEARLFEQG